AAELAELALPGLPRVKRKINEVARARRWALEVDAAGFALARPRAGQRGGGLEYHHTVLPAAAATELVKRGLAVPENVVIAHPRPADQLWSWYERQSETVKTEAQARLEATNAVAELEARGSTRSAAVAVTAAARSVSPATLWLWLRMIKGAEPGDHLPRLAAQRQGGGARATIDPRVWTLFLSDYLRPSAPTLASCYERAKAFAVDAGIEIPHQKTFARRLDQDVDGRLVVARRSGQDALRATIPHQRRSVADLHAMELVNIDGHKWDVFVRWPNGTVARPMMVALQDIQSRKFLAWRIGETESAVLTRLALGDLFKRFGIPDGILLDNGRAFASKWITGGSKTRFRFKIRAEEPTGLLTALGVKIHWALPYRGSSKPIERGFRDFCDAIAKHPAFEGAYTGNRPDAKPENYGSRAIDLEVFKRIVERGIAAHNARPGRRTEMAAGRSFDAVFEESYAQASVRRAGPEQLRLALLAADQVTADRKSGEVSLYGNRYWSDALYAVAGQRLTVRFDPDDLQSEVHVYTADGAFLATAPVIAATGFLDADAAKRRARQEADVKKKAKALAAAEDLLSADQIAAMLPDADDEDTTPRPAAVRPVRARGVAMAAARPAEHRAPLIDKFADAMEANAPRPKRPALTILDGGLE
ncbi:MAG: transposase domain-containing protein, partial [Reyranella sp.]|nr:transposase domain-containing protein [Reyranella sp.]